MPVDVANPATDLVAPPAIQSPVAEISRPHGLMMENSLPPDLEYCLDCTQEDGSLGFDERAFVELYDENVMDWFLSVAESNASQFTPQIKARYLAWRQTAEPFDRMGLDWAGIRGLRWLFDECAVQIGHELIHEQERRNVWTDDLASAVRDIDLATTPSFRRFTECAEPIVGRAIEDLALYGVESFQATHLLVETLYQNQRPQLRIRRDANSQLLRDLSARQIANAVAALDQHLPQAKPHIDRRKEKRLRNVIKRSFALLRDIAGEQRAKAWVAGEEVTVEGRRFDFRLRVTDIRNHSVGAIDVFVTDKDKIELAKLCIYAPDTPALDQLASLILHVISGQEDMIVRTGNIIRVTAAAEGNLAFTQIRAEIKQPLYPFAEDVQRVADEQDQIRTALIPLRQTFAQRLDQAVWQPLIARLGPSMAWIESPNLARDITSPWVHDRGFEDQPVAAAFQV